MLANSAIIVAIALMLRVRRSDFVDLLRAQIVALQGRGRTIRPSIYLFIYRRYAALQAAVADSEMRVARLYSDATYTNTKIVLSPETNFEFVDPEIIRSAQPPRKRCVRLPSLWCATIKQVQIFGSMQIATETQFLVSDPAADPDFSYVAGQVDYITGRPLNRFRAKETVFAKLPSIADALVPEAILLGGRCGNNYFHFLIEYVTKGYIIEQITGLGSLPLIIPDELYPQEIEVLRIVFPNHTLLRHKRGTRMDVETLHVPSVMTFIPDCPKIPFWQVAAMNHDSLTWLRERVFASIQVPHNRPPHRKIYLGRAQGRNIINSDEVTALFEKDGFEIVDTGKMSFTEQVVLFSTASHIAGPLGAAFANLVFCSPGTKVLGIVSPFAVQLSLFKSLADFSKCQYYALPGTHKRFKRGMDERRPPLHISHGSFSVDLDYVSDALEILRQD